MEYAIVNMGVVKAIITGEVDSNILVAGDSVVSIIPPQVAHIGDRVRIRPDGRILFLSTPRVAPKKTSLETGEFLLRFSTEERVAIRTAAKENATLDDFVELLKVLPTVNFTNTTLVAGMQLLVDLGILTRERAAFITTP